MDKRGENDSSDHAGPEHGGPGSNPGPGGGQGPGEDHGPGGGNPGQGHQITIIVNGREKKWAKETISYQELADLSGLPLPQGQNPGFTITYHNGPANMPDGSVVPGQTVKVKDREVFSVTPTNQS